MRWLPRVLRGDARAPRDVDAALRGALLAALHRNWEEAERLLVGAARLDSDSLETYLALALVYRHKGEIGRAIRIHQNLLMRLEPGSPRGLEALEGLAEDFRQGGFAARAIASYEELLAHAPRHAGALEALVELHSEEGDPARAVALARQLAKREGRNARSAEAELRTRVAQAAHSEGRTDEARKAVRQALRRDKGCVQAWLLLGEIEAERGRAKAALAAWSKVPRLDRTAGPLVYPMLEATWAALDRARDFETFLRELLGEQPDDAATRLALARTLASRGDVGDALGELGALLERDPENIAARVAQGRLLLVDGRDAEAAKAHAELLELLSRGGSGAAEGGA
jgi:lipopolysaccharide biosynthesis regulator YciM